MSKAARFFLAALLVGTLAIATTGNAAEKVVMAEQFTATWCSACPTATRALYNLMQSYPDTFILLKVHGGDSYATSWGNARRVFYSSGAYPDVWFGGTMQVEGSWPTVSQTYTQYLSRYNTLRSQSTDVVLEIGGVNTGGENYDVSVRVTLEETGTAKDVKLYIVQVLDHYPSNDAYYRNCFIQAAPTQTLSLEPGLYSEFTHTFTLSGASASDHEDVRFIAWAQTTSSSGPATIYQATMMTWPFTELPPPPTVLGDFDDSGLVDMDDIPALLLALLDPPAYATAYPEVDLLSTGDINEDGFFDPHDIAGFVDILTYDVYPPTPDPMTWASEPAPVSTTAISMTASTASDNSGVEYLFASSSGASLSTWQTSPTFVHQNLNKNYPYAYKVKARDLSVEQNETQFSSPDIWAATAIETPTGITITNVASDSMDVTADGTLTNVSFGNSGLYFEMTPHVAGSGANEWIIRPSSTTLHVTGLDPDTEYTFRVKAVNYFGENETPFTAPVNQSTTP